MPVGRKHAGKGSRASYSHHTAAAEDTRSGRSSATAVEDDLTKLVLPSHPEFPTLPPPQGELFFECTLFLYSVLALFLQYLNLYKLMWWLPNYHSQSLVFARLPLKLNLINPYLLSCVGLILGRRVTWCFLRKLTISPLMNDDPPFCVKAIEWVVKSPLLGAVMTSFMFSFTQVIVLYPFKSLLYLVYPVVIYCVFFRKELRYVLGAPSNYERMQRLWAWIQTSNFSVEPTAKHACSSSPERIREEVHLLTMDFYLKIKQSIFSSVCAAYYAIFVPVCFVPLSLHTDPWWAFELCVIVFMTSLLLHWTYDFRIGYCDLLHRAASHLGAWAKIDNPRVTAINLPYHTWSSQTLWSEGSVVKQDRTLFRGLGTPIAAEPDNRDHKYFYILFSDPLFVLNSLCIVDACMIFLQFLMLVHSSDWQHVVTLVLLMFANYYMLFQLFKNKIILSRIYNPNPEDEEFL